jgi:hypothetical protein
MKEVNLNSTSSTIKSERLVVNLTNTSTGEVRKLEYDVRKLSGRAAMEAQITLAEYAKDKKRDEIVGSLIFKGILAGVEPIGDAPELLAILDEIETDQLQPFLQALMEAATGSTVTS